MVRGGRAEALVSRSDVSFRLDKKTGNFKVAIGSRPMQWSALTEEKQKNQLAQTGVRFMIAIKRIRVAAITLGPSPPNQSCTAAKDGKFQGDHDKQTNAVECFFD